jgi:hypothetical protein
MPLVKCPDCGRDVSDVAPACPGCGRPVSAPAPLAPAAPSQRSMVDVGFIVVTIVILFGWWGWSKATKADDPPAAEARQAAPALRRDADAVEITEVLAQMNHFTCEVGSAEWSWDTCADQEKGYKALLKCTTEALDVLQPVRAALPPKTLARSSCAVQLETAIRNRVLSMTAFMEDELAWVQTVTDEERRALSGTSLTDACQKIQCRKQPVEDDPKYPGLVFSTKMPECVEETLSCRWQSREPLPCDTGRAAVSMGVNCGGDHGEHAPLFSRATRSQVWPLTP